MDFSKKVTLVTGASRGIGLAFAKRFNQEGSDLYLVSRSFSDDYLSNFDQSQGQKINLCPCDLSDSQQRAQLIKKINAETSVDVLVNNAGLLTGGRLQEIDPDFIEKTIAVNLTATILLTQAFLPKMLEKNSGLVINNASVSGEFYFPGAQVYAATKSGVVLFTKSLRMELERTGVRTLLLLTPGVKTKMYDEIPDKFGELVNLDFMTSITPEQWVGQAFDSIKKGEHTCYPKGQTRLGLFLNRHFPGLYERSFRTYYKEEKSRQ